MLGILAAVVMEAIGKSAHVKASDQTSIQTITALQGVVIVSGSIPSIGRDGRQYAWRQRAGVDGD
jgi:hypothetical protein